jgi:hypothetical protein
MKNGNDANGKSKHTEQKPYAMVGAGRLAASIWKTGDERRGWTYQFNVFRMYRVTGRVTQRFSPKDVADLAKLTQVLAFTLADDGCVSDDMRDDLFCLAACLDEVLPSRAVEQGGCRAPITVLNAIEQVVGCIWEYKEREFRASPSNNHIYRQLVVIRNWIAGNKADEPASLDSSQPDEFGGCPICCKHDGYLNIGRTHWFVCHQHRTCWAYGAGIFSSWSDGTEEEYLRNWERIKHYLEVQPIYSPGDSQMSN